MSTRKYLLFILFFSAAFNLVYAQSRNQSFSELVQKTNLIVHVKVTDAESRWVANLKGKHIYTFATIEVKGVVKGNMNQDYFSLDIIGGKVNDTTEVVSESFMLKKNDEMVLFLQQDPLKVVNGNEGVFPVHNNKLYLERMQVTIDEFATAITKIILNEIKVENIQELENSIIQNRIKLEQDRLNTDQLKLLRSKANQLLTLAAPNLIPYKPTDWSDKIVVKKNIVNLPIGTQLSSDDSPLYDSDDLYLAFSVANSGDANAAAFTIKIYVDNVEVLSNSYSNLQGNYYVYWWNASIGSLSQGAHTIKIVADANNQVTESNESDNEYTRNVTIQHLAGTPLITSITPSSASAGTGTNITISGSGFGATRGTSIVEFFYRDGEPKIQPTNYVSWSDNQIVCAVPIGDINGYPATASSGPVAVTTTIGRSNAFNLDVPFSYGDVKWDGSFPIVVYKINENYSGVVGEGNAILSAMNTWNSTNANFRFTYGGTSTVTDATFDNENSITFGSTAGSLASNYYWYEGARLLESDIVFNSSQYTFSTTGSPGTFDIESLILHEMGHTLNLRDLYGSADSYRTMYGYSSDGVIKRSLSAGDISGIRYIYGSGGSFVTYTISGTITFGGNPLSNVIVALSGSSTQSFTTGTDGTYSFTVLAGGNYMITPSKAQYNFSPVNRTFNNISTNQVQNFSATLQTYTISGTITYNGNPLNNVIINLSGSSTQQVTTSTNGNYSFTVSSGGNYTITANRTEYNFTPTSQSFNNITSNQVQNFTATLKTFTISGIISYNSSLLAGVTVSVSGSTNQSVTTNSSGSYSLTVPYGSSCIVTPSKLEYNFTPTSSIYNNITSHQAQNYNATLKTFTINGMISFNSNPLEGVIASLIGTTNQSITTTSTGSYSFTVQYGSSYTITPLKTDYIFTPTNITFNNIISNQMQNFIAMFNRFTISGTVSYNGNFLSGTTVNLYGASSQSTTTNTLGIYSFTVIGGANYTVTPTKAGYGFTPSSISVNNIVQDETRNFTTSIIISRGDVDNDGRILAYDAVLILINIVGLYIPNDPILWNYAADTNTDSIINLEDAVNILKFIVYEHW